MRTTKRLHEKKAYQSPRLVTYGAIREFTQAVGKTGNLDGGTGKQRKSGI